jgi:hypothetical protein
LLAAAPATVASVGITAAASAPTTSEADDETSLYEVPWAKSAIFAVPARFR